MSMTMALDCDRTSSCLLQKAYRRSCHNIKGTDTVGTKDDYRRGRSPKTNGIVGFVSEPVRKVYTGICGTGWSWSNAATFDVGRMDGLLAIVHVFPLKPRWDKRPLVHCLIGPSPGL